MKITLHTIPVRDLVAGFENNDEQGVVGYGGKLNIRPAYQREFVYNDRQQKEVVYSIFKGFPLNVMYWVKTADGMFELLDGQQRTLSICSFWNGEFFVELDGVLKGFDNLTDDQRARFLDYALQIYVCEDGTDQEQLDWFRIINIAGEKLTQQELRNAVYTGTWITSAKQRFSKTGCVAFKLGEKYMDGSPIRQDYLETVLDWISQGAIEPYMAQHQHDTNADREWQYFQRVIAWVQSVFPVYRKEMKGLAWGTFYNRFRNRDLNASELETRIQELMTDDEIEHPRGIYEYLLTGDERKLCLRTFSEKIKRRVYEQQKGICAKCLDVFDYGQMEADHVTPWSKGGTTTIENCQLLCRDCNRRKSDH